jgi:hypothetical protein
MSIRPPIRSRFIVLPSADYLLAKNLLLLEVPITTDSFTLTASSGKLADGVAKHLKF